MRSPVLIPVLLIGAAALRAQPATYSYFGTECRPVIFAVAGTPKLGTTIDIHVEPTYSQRGGGVTSLLVTGISKTRWGGLKLPFDTRVLGRTPNTFCGHIYTSIDIVVPVPSVPYPPKRVVLKMPIPNARALLGLSFYQQVVMRAYCGSHGCQGYTWTYTSRAGHGTIGT